jgi:hypothetical protein
MSNLDYALRYAERGWRVFPCNIDKTPKTENGFKDASRDPEKIKAWWSQYPDASIGMACGKESGVWVLDIDMPDGIKSLSEIERENERLPKTLSQRTGGNGTQYFWKWNGHEIRNKAGLKTNIDVRGEGGYVILPPSSHPSGNAYRWIGKDSIIEAPQWLAELVSSPRVNPQQKQNNGSSSYGQAALAGEILNVINSSEGSRNDTLNVAAFKLGQLVSGGELTQDAVESALLGAAMGKGLSAKEIRATVKSGLAAGMKEARRSSNSVESVETVESVENVGNTPSQLKALKPVENQLKTQLKTEITIDALREWVLLDSRRFTLQDAYRDFDARTSYEKKLISTYLGRIEKQKLIERDGNQRGVFNCTSKEKESSLITIFNSKTLEWSEEVSFIEMYYPLNLDNLVGLLPGNIVIVAGESNVGKTVTLLDWAFHNLKSSRAFTSKSSGKYETIPYFSSEMGSSELIMRARAFGYPPAAWEGFRAYERSEDFHQVIDPDGLNFIDFLEIHDEFYKIGAKIRAIHETLKSGICVIALQKKTGKDVGRGGEMSLEKPRLYISLSEAVKGVVSTARIIKAKNYKTTWNPNGMQLDFKIEGKGSRIVPVSEWRFLTQSERELQNRKYELELGNKKPEEFKFMCKNNIEVVLRVRDVEQWIKSFPYTNVEKELLRISQNSYSKPWMDEKNWFHQLSGFLSKKDREAKGDK